MNSKETGRGAGVSADNEAEWIQYNRVCVCVCGGGGGVMQQ